MTPSPKTPAGIHLIGRRQLSPRLVLLSFVGADLRGRSFTPGDKVKLGVGGTLLRSYTPSRFDAERGEMDIIFHLHGQGPASDWARDLEPGDETVVFGPVKSLAPGPPTPWARFYGDETTLGLAVALVEGGPANRDIGGAIEIDPDDAIALSTLGLPLEPALRSGAYGDALVEHAELVPLPDGQGIVWISGHAGSVLAVRDTLRARGVERDAIRIKPYWSDRGKAHRKSVELQARLG